MTDIVSIEVRGTVGDVYDVMIVRNPGSVRITCSCPAGRSQTACWHRLALIRGDYRHVRTGKDAALRDLHAWLEGSTLALYVERLNAAEAALTAATEELSRAKRALGRVMDSG